MRRAKSDYAIQTVVNALRTLEAFESEAEVGVSELSRRLDLHKNNVFRLLATLEQKGYVEQVAANDRYRLGPACLRIGRAFAESRGIGAEARRILAELATRLGETAHLGVRQGPRVLHLEGHQAPGFVVTGLRVGTELPCHATALGKILIACGTPDRIGSYPRSGESLDRRTPNTIVDTEKLVEHLHGVANQGFALDIEECEPGLSCAAVPVLDGDGTLAAALSVSGPSFRLSPRKLEAEIVPALADAAARLSRALGFTQ